MSRRSGPVRWAVLTAFLAVGSLTTACSAPGGTTPPQGTTAGSAPTTTTTATGATPTCGTAPVALNMYIETGFPLPKNLSDEFTKQYPNVTFNVREDQFAVITQNAPRVLADDPPDLMRLPQVSELAKDGLLLQLAAQIERALDGKWNGARTPKVHVTKA